MGTELYKKKYYIMNINDNVELAVDLPAHGIVAGTKGTIVLVHTTSFGDDHVTVRFPSEIGIGTKQLILKTSEVKLTKEEIAEDKKEAKAAAKQEAAAEAALEAEKIEEAAKEAPVEAPVEEPVKEEAPKAKPATKKTTKKK